MQEVSSRQQIDIDKGKMPSHRRLLLWYLVLALLGAAIGAVSWFLLLPGMGIALTVAVLALANLGLMLSFAYSNRAWLSRMDHYPRTGFFVVSVSLSLIVFMTFGASSMGLLIPMLFFAPFLFRSIIAGATYIARMRDLHNFQQRHATSQKEMKEKQLAKYDFWAISIGTLLGIGIMVLTIAGGAIAPQLMGTLDFLVYGFVGVAGIASFGGFLNRIVARNRMEGEQWVMRRVFVLAALAAVLLCAFSVVPIVAATGFMTASFLGIPASLFLYLFFVPSFTGAFVSMSDYVSKTVVYVSSLYVSKSCSDYLKDKNKKHEYLGAALGMLIGLLVGAVLLYLMVTQPLTFAALVVAKSLAGKIILSLFVGGAFSGSASRLFKLFDDREKLDEADRVASKAKTSVTVADPADIAAMLAQISIKVMPAKDKEGSFSGQAPRSIKLKDEDSLPSTSSASSLPPSRSGSQSQFSRNSTPGHTPTGPSPDAAGHFFSDDTVPYDKLSAKLKRGGSLASIPESSSESTLGKKAEGKGLESQSITVQKSLSTDVKKREVEKGGDQGYFDFLGNFFNPKSSLRPVHGSPDKRTEGVFGLSQ